MEVDQYPTMRFDLQRLTVRATGQDTAVVALLGTLSLHGRQREVTMPGRVWTDGDGWRVRADFPLNLKDYEIGGLSKMLGILKMDEHIVVHVDVTFSP
jgi:polyisoprenoid-binding protein YceI